jgi:hypothetical protein
VMGRWGVIVGVCTEPVTAQVMMTLRPVLGAGSAAGWDISCDLPL